MIKKYIFDGVEYLSEYEVRQAVFKKNRIAFGNPMNAEEWLALGVEYREDEYPLDVLKALKLTQLESSFMQWRNDGATLFSSLGFEVDCDERAMIDVNGLVTICGETQTVVFMDADNFPHELSLGQLKTLQAEIIQSGTMAYQKKWEMRQAICSSNRSNELNAIPIEFTPVRF